MSIDRLSERSGGVIGTIGPIGGSGVFSLQERYALTADNYENVSLYLKMNGANGSTTFYDSSLYGHTVTANGNAQISTAQSKFGGASAAFDGAGDWLSVARNAAFIPTTGDFTIEMWVYPNSLQQALLAGLIEAGVAADWAFETLTNGKIGFFIGSAVQSYFSTATYQSGKWNHVMVCRSGSTLYIGINGVVNSTTATGSLDNGQSYPLTIGADQNGDERLFNGYIDDLRITKGVARYTGNFTPPQREFRP